MDELEAIFKHRLNELVDRLVVSIQTRLQDTGLDIGGMRTEVGRMDDSLKLLNDVVESARSQQLELSAANRALKAENEALQREVADLEQYSRLNNLEIKGVPYTQGEDYDDDCATASNAAAYDGGRSVVNRSRSRSGDHSGSRSRRGSRSRSPHRACSRGAPREAPHYICIKGLLQIPYRLPSRIPLGLLFRAPPRLNRGPPSTIGEPSGAIIGRQRQQK
ncbi:hypothetical protein HPB49_005845 [Dermacentor silvarum]|uniref:Uncharacterized protein n=1 Tax=Dermacentor silvarum TaxID=543639 RepID=A0ACB8DW90_DERSI|nr:hypothetical protein HPB49_005845 [Dermacentor silvarum]